MVTVTISREYGAGGTEIARRVARQLGGRYLVREIIEMAYEYGNLPAPETTPPVPERETPGLARRIVDAIAGAISSGRQPQPHPFGEESHLRAAVASDEAYVALMRGVIERVVEESPNSVIVGRGGQQILAGRPGVLHLHICGNFSDRVRRTMQVQRLNEEAAANFVRARDAERAQYIRRYYNADWQQPSLYHLTLNTSWLSYDQAVDLIMQAAQMVAI